MTIFIQTKYLLFTTIAIALTSGIIAYSVMAYTPMPYNIIVPLAIIISILIFGLSNYYSKIAFPIDDNQYLRINDSGKGQDEHDLIAQIKGARKESVNAIQSMRSVIVISLIYLILIIISFFSNPDLVPFLNWNELSPVSFIQLGASVVLCFFLTGYMVIHNFSRKYKLNPLLRIIAGYLFSILITGLDAYYDHDFAPWLLKSKHH